ncbi:MAG TPA: DNA methyltransferase [Bacillota bacterium]|nr:DNA methyltransferase [Bacillota bacterium]
MKFKQQGLFPEHTQRAGILTGPQLHTAMAQFAEFGKTTEILKFPDPGFELPVYVNEFWTARQRAAHSLHEISYRACFKPQLPRFFITRLTGENDVVYDPFMGRGTTVIEAALLNRVPAGCDINPLSRILTAPRLNPPEPAEIRQRLQLIDLEKPRETREDLLTFYHPETLLAITNLRSYLLQKEKDGNLDHIDAWIRMVATNRLTGHSRGFFSVYTLPPNQAVSVEAQRKINEKRSQAPPRRDVREIILHKSRSLLRKLQPGERSLLHGLSDRVKLITASAEETPQIAGNSVNLVVTSPPFLDIVAYAQDNWLRCWFNGIDPATVKLWHFRKPADWQEKMTAVFKELKRILVPGGHVAFEVGEVRRGQILLETLVVPAALAAGLTPEMVIINSQAFTKTANCWGIDNLKKGTNTNRIILLRK